MTLAVAMVFGLVSNGFGELFMKNAYAASTDYFSGTGVSTGSTLTDWTWSKTPGTYKYNSTWSNAIELWNSSSLTAQFYYTVSSLPAGSYTLMYTYYAGSGVTIQPYINGTAQGTVETIDSTSLTEVTVEYDFTTTSDITSGKFGLQFVFSSGGWAHINNIYLYSNVGTYAYAGTYTTPVVTVKTTAESVSYPSEVTIDLYNEEAQKSKTEDVAVTWTDTGSVDLSAEGTYYIYGYFTYDDEEYECIGMVTVIESAGSGTADFTGIVYKGVLVNGGDMIKGADVSSVISVENSGVQFYDEDGNEEDLIKILADAGVNYIRVRIWNDPYRASATTEDSKTAANSYGGGVCDLNYAVQLAERCAKYGVKYFVSFHYSDWWADPGRCIAPKAWANYSTSEKADAIAEFTTEALEEIAATGVDIGMVSVGNETTNYLCGISGISNFVTLLESGCAAVREFDPNILIALHFTNPETWNYASSFASVLESNGADYDIFSTSYYPAWHGTLSNLESKLEAVSTGYDKLTMITEFSYPYTLSDLDGDACTVSSIESSVTSVFGSASSTSGQHQALTTMLDYIPNIEDCVGMFYWEPAWISVYTSKSKNSTLWSTYGSGWTTKYSSEYDSDNGSSSVGGSGCENQALFDMDGQPLEALEAFNDSWTDGYKPLLSEVLCQVTNYTYKVESSGVERDCVSIRFLSIIDDLSYSAAGFKIEVYDSDGTIIKTIAKKSVVTVYEQIKANGEVLTPDEGYYFMYHYTNVPTDTTYYFKVIPYSASLVGTADNVNIYQLGYKIYKLENGSPSVVSEIGA